MDKLFEDFIQHGLGVLRDLWLTMQPHEQDMATKMQQVADARGKFPAENIVLGALDAYMVELVLETDPKTAKEALYRIMYFYDGLTQPGGYDEPNPVL